MIAGNALGLSFLGGGSDTGPVTKPVSLTAISKSTTAVNKAMALLLLPVSVILASLGTSRHRLSQLIAGITTDSGISRRLGAIRSLLAGMTTGAVNILGCLNQLGLTAALTLAATSVQGAGRILAVSINSIGSLWLFRHKLMLVTMTMTSAIYKAVSIGLIYETALKATIKTALLVQRALGAAINSTALIFRGITASIKATGALRATGKLLFGKPLLLLVAIGTTALVDTAFVFTRSITAAVSLVPHFTKALRTILFVTQTAFTAISRAMAFRLATSVIGRCFQSRVTGMTRIAALQASSVLNRIRIFAVAITSVLLTFPVVDSIKAYIRRLSAMQITNPEMLRGISKNLMARLRGTSGVIKALTKALFAGMEAAADIKRTQRLLVAMACGLSTVANSATVQLFKRALSAIQTISPNQLRAVGKNLISRVRGTGSFIRNYPRIVLANISVSGSVSRIVSRSLSMFSGVIAISGLKNVQRYVRLFVTDTQTKANYNFQLGKQLRVRLNLRIALMRHWPMRLMTGATINCLLATALIMRCVADAARRVMAPLLRQAYRPERKRPLVPGKARIPKA